MGKVCSKCGIEKSVECFSKDSNRKDGLQRRCKDCVAKYGKHWRKDNPEYGKHWAKDNKDSRAKYAKKWRENNKSERAEYARRWRKDNKEATVEYDRQYYQENKEKYRLHYQRYRARKLGLPDTLTDEQIESMLHHFNHSCVACGIEFSTSVGMEIDHWIPVSSPDCTGTIATNMIPLCGNKGRVDGDIPCNQSKHNKDAETWLIERFGESKAKEVLNRVNDYFNKVREI